MCRQKVRIFILVYSLFLILDIPHKKISAQESFPIKLEKVYSFESLAINYGYYQIKFHRGHVVEIDCEKGVTGLVVTAKGEFSYGTRENEEPIAGPFKTVLFSTIPTLFRFNPADYDTIFQFQEVTITKNKKMLSRAEEFLGKSFLYLFHHRMEALIPPPKTLSGVFAIKEFGTIVVGELDEKRVVFSPSKKQIIFEEAKSQPSLSGKSRQ